MVAEKRWESKKRGKRRSPFARQSYLQTYANHYRYPVTAAPLPATKASGFTEGYLD